MVRVLGTGLLTLAMVGLAALDIHAQEKKAAIAAESIIDSAKLKPGDFAGYLKTVPGPDRKFILEIDTGIPVAGAAPRPNYNNSAQTQMIRARQQIQQAQMRMQQARTPQQRMQAQQQLNQVQQQIARSMAQAAAQAQRAAATAKPAQVKTIKREVEFQVSENVKVRTLILPEQFDEKGNVKRPTGKDLEALKGADKNLPGIESGLDKLEPGVPVRVTMVAVSREAPAKGSAGTAKGSKEDKDGDADPGDKPRQVRLMIILGPPDPGTSGAK